MQYINQASQLQDVLEIVRLSSWAAVDTEADSLHHYTEKLCLLQVNAGGEDFVIDPLVGLDLKPLIENLSKKTLILHGADFDIRLLHRFFGFIPQDIFDTMIAAQLLGYEKQGLADLAKIHCGASLSKASQKADWSERPLEEELLRYAANDVHYLKTLHDILRQKLVATARLDWHRQYCKKLIRTATTAKVLPGEEFAWQIKGTSALQGKSLTLFKALWHWRDQKARSKDWPSFKVLHSKVMLQLARWAAEDSPKDVAKLPNAPRSLKRQYREELNSLLKRSAGLPQAKFVGLKKAKKVRPNNVKSKETFQKLRKERQRIAEHFEIQPSLLATNAVLELLAVKCPKNRQELKALDCLMPWQFKILAGPFLAILDQ